MWLGLDENTFFDSDLLPWTGWAGTLKEIGLGSWLNNLGSNDKLNQLLVENPLLMFVKLKDNIYVLTLASLIWHLENEVKWPWLTDLLYLFGLILKFV